MLNLGNDINEYREISVLNAEHSVYVVQNTHTNAVALKKTMTVYDAGVYVQLYEHPVKGVPRIYALKEDNNTLTVIEEFVSGTTLQDMLEKNGIMPEDRVADHMIRLCDILSELHGRKPSIIHRDIKPSNIIKTDDGRIVLIDLNAARTYKHGQNQDTRFIGTDGFAPPEQVGYGQTVPQTDIYALGVTMNVLLTGTIPSVKQASGAFGPIIGKCIKNDPENRYSSAAALKKQLITAKRNLNKSKKKWRLPMIIASVIAFLAVFAVMAFLGITHVSKQIRSEKVNNAANILSFDAQSGGAASPDSLVGNKEAVLDTTKAEGVYTGNDLEVLVLDTDGLAYYYCVSSEFTELECPWRQEGNRIFIDFSRMHCTVYADVKDGDYSELILRTESHNWNTEVFDKIALEPHDYIGRTIEMHDKNASMNKDGTIRYVNQNLAFTIPKSFIDLKDEMDEMDDVSAFVEIDADNNYAAGLMFFGYEAKLKKGADKDRITEEMEKFMGNFMREVSVSDMTEITVAGLPAYAFNVSGRYNKGFGSLSGREVSGRSVLICNTEAKKELYATALQAESSIYNVSPVFDHILSTAITVN